MNTLALTPPTPDSGWDLYAVDGNIAVITGASAIAQDMASAIKTFLGECWYNLSLGVRYLSPPAPGAGQDILGQRPAPAFIKAQFVAAATTVPGVTAPVCYLTGPDPRTRVLGGQVQSVLPTGETVVASSLPGVAPWYVTGASPNATGAIEYLSTDSGQYIITGGGQYIVRG